MRALLDEVKTKNVIVDKGHSMFRFRKIAYVRKGTNPGIFPGNTIRNNVEQDLTKCQS